MIIGIPKEIKDNEYRVAMVPAGVRELTEAGHKVLVETKAGMGSTISDDEFAQAGAKILKSAEEVYKKSDLIVKVKEPLKEEFGYLRKDLIIFTFLHLAANAELTTALLKSGVTAIGYETVGEKHRGLPILTPMSEIAGRLSIQIGANLLLKSNGGRGVLLGGIPGVAPGRVVIIGAGVVGLNAAKMATGLGASVTLINNGAERLRYFDDLFGSRITTLHSNAYNIERALKDCDLLIGAAHAPGARTPKLVTRKMLRVMRRGAVIIDVSVDQGGCVETIRPTTHSEPTYEVDDIIHYGVANMPGSVPCTSTFALTNVTILYITALANNGLKKAVESDKSLAHGVNIHKGQITNKGVAKTVGAKHHHLLF
jgi:alanine dehydrogenase